MEFEKYIPKRVNKDVAPDAMESDGARSFSPGNLLDAENCRYVDPSSGKIGVLKSTPGNVVKALAAPAGINKCIGSFLFEKENTVIFMVWNSNGNHRIIEWNKEADTFQVLLSGSSLNFQENALITEGKTIDDLHIFNDKFNRPRKYNIRRARAGGYTAPYSEYAISLAIKPPIQPPVVTVNTENSSFISFITKDTWQFAYSFGYLDNSTSAISQLSKLAWAGFNLNVETTRHKSFQISIVIPSQLIGLLNKVEFYARKGNDGNLFLFKTVNNPQTTNISVQFRNNESQYPVATANQDKYYDQIPDRTEALDIIDSRVFLSLNQLGFNENPNAVLSVTLGVFNEIESPISNRWFKNGGAYSVGILYTDDFGKTSFVELSQTINIPFILNPNLNGFNCLNWSLSGTPPSYAKKYQIVLSKNKIQSTYFQVRAVTHFYIRDLSQGEKDNSTNAQGASKEGGLVGALGLGVTYDAVPASAYWWRGKYFVTAEHIYDISASWVTWNLLYLKVPTNIPFIPDKTYYVKFLHPNWPVGVRTIAPVIEYNDIFIVVDFKFKDPTTVDSSVGINANDIFPWDLFPDIIIEVFTYNEQPDPRFFEIGECFDVNNGNFSVLSGTLRGDTWNLLPNYQYEAFAFKDSDTITGTFRGIPTTLYDVYETPTGVVVNSVIQRSVGITKDNASLLVPSNIQTLDYTKASSDYGRAFIEKIGSKINNFFNLIGFSDPYIQNTDINGLSSFLATNTYPIAVERSPIRALRKAGRNLISIHERNATTLYIGEGILRQGVDFLTAKIDRVIGDDRDLNGGWGTINSESVYEYNGDLYWWDGLEGAVIRYTNAGMFPISIYGMESYFLNKANEYALYRDQIKVITCVDKANDEFVITFPDVVVNNSLMVKGVTWAFKIKQDIWVTRYSYQGEMYQRRNTDYLAFKDGQLWIQNINPVHNNFFGIQYSRKIRFVSNAKVGIRKKYLNVHLKGDFATDQSSLSFNPVKIYTPEGQESFIPSYEFELDEGKWCAPILKDINTPVPINQLALRSGDDIVSDYIEIEIENNRLDQAPMNHMNVVFKTENFSI